MSNIDFKLLKTTTMTVVINLKGTIELDVVFPLLKISRFTDINLQKNINKYKLPFCTIPGSIISARYAGYTRGMEKINNKKYFKNSITLDISTIKKNVSIKLSKCKMHMCGLTSMEMVNEAYQFVASQLIDIQNNLDYINEHQMEYNDILGWFIKNLKGKELPNNKGYHCINYSSCIPNTLDSKICIFLLNQIYDYYTYEDYIFFVNWVITKKVAIIPPIDIISIDKAMVNYNYDLGFQINKQELSKRINGLNGFNVSFENTIHRSVTIILPYEHPNPEIRGRKDKIYCHTFLVYKSGLVTQSGPNEVLMEHAYNLFNSTINMIRPHIIIVTKRKLRYIQSDPDHDSV